jgi:hypothetical protein
MPAGCIPLRRIHAERPLDVCWNVPHLQGYTLRGPWIPAGVHPSTGDTHLEAPWMLAGVYPSARDTHLDALGCLLVCTPPPGIHT